VVGRTFTLSSPFDIEGVAAPAVGGFLPLDPGSIAIHRWQVTRGQIDSIGDPWSAAQGQRSLDLHGSPGFGGIERTFATEKGPRYRVTFALAGSLGSNPPVKRIAVSAAGKSATFSFDSSGRNSDEMRRVEYTWQFEAIASRTVLELRTLETTDPYAGPALDEVRVDALICSVSGRNPEGTTNNTNCTNENSRLMNYILILF
jgi:choice-of-anchor C domain-containing protein